MGNSAPNITHETHNQDALLAGSNQLPVTRTVTLITGQNLLRGALLGRITASGKYNLSLSAAGDGSNTPVAILVEDTDASAADKLCGIYEAGEFNELAMTFGAGHTADSVRAGLRDLNIHLKKIVL
jgi:hypothetical protein